MQAAIKRTIAANRFTQLLQGACVQQVRGIPLLVGRLAAVEHVQPGCSIPLLYVGQQRCGGPPTEPSRLCFLAGA
jgi:hypothetical protein